MALAIRFGILLLAIGGTMAAPAGGDVEVGSAGGYALIPSPVALPGEIVPSLPGQMVRALPGQIVRALPGQIVPPLPGQIVSPLPGQIVPPLPGQVVRALPGQVVPAMAGEIFAAPPALLTRAATPAPRGPHEPAAAQLAKAPTRSTQDAMRLAYPPGAVAQARR